MSTEVDNNDGGLNACGCCEGIAAQTPVEVTNRPGLSAVAYRVGTHPQFKQSLLAGLTNAARPALVELSTRDADDFSIALLDAWATCADVLTFYQERIANESYLRTATERESLLHLARLIGYELRPGVAASAYLAFTVEEAPAVSKEMAAALGVTGEASVGVGVKVQSVPGPGERAQMFETVEAIEAHAEWNAIVPVLSERHPIKADAETLYFAGLTTGLRKGDGLIIAPDDGSAPLFRQVGEVFTDDLLQRTEVRLQTSTVASSSSSSESLAESSSSTVTLFTPSYARRGGLLPSLLTSQLLGKIFDAADLFSNSIINDFSIGDVFDNIAAVAPPPPSVLALRTRAAIFGHLAPRWETLPVNLRIGEVVTTATGGDSTELTSSFVAGSYSTRQNSWAETTLDAYGDPADPPPPDAVFLDSVYPNIVQDSWLALKNDKVATVYQVEEAVEVARADFASSAKVTRLRLKDAPGGFDAFTVRDASVFAQSEELALARLPIKTPVAGKELNLDTSGAGMFAGQLIILCGELETARGIDACELATIERVEQVFTQTEAYTRLTLAAELSHAYVRDTVTINANVALATHGETVSEVLGSGDASKPFQSFTLRQPPLTHVSARTPGGTATTLEVRVNGLLWHEVASFYGHGAEERIYITRMDDDNVTAVHFGDGKTGARLPTGQENVVAVYRKGIGLAGQVKAHQLSQLMTRPHGVSGVGNPLAANGAADSETRDEARLNAPTTVLTLDRIVSLRDYEDFARATTGIEKALATWTWIDEKRSVFVTVAGVGGAALQSTTDANLLASMRAAGDASIPLSLASYNPRFFLVSAKIKIDADRVTEDVLAEVEAKLRASFSFKARAFGQPVMLGEVVAVMHAVSGVVAVDVDELYRHGEDADKLNDRLPAALPRFEDNVFHPAELLTLDPRPVRLEVMT